MYNEASRNDCRIILRLRNILSLDDYEQYDPVKSAWHVASLLKMPISSHTQIPSCEEGICRAASVYMAHLLLSNPPQTEAALIALLNPLEHGFPTIVQSLQSLSDVNYSFLRRDENFDALVKEAIEARTDLEAIAQVTDNLSTAILLNTIWNWGHEFRYFSISSKPTFEPTLSFGPRTQDFSALPCGTYLIHFSFSENSTTKHERAHVILFYKSTFGAYLIDSNHGVLKLNPNSISPEIKAHIVSQAKLFINSQRSPHIKIFSNKLDHTQSS